MKEWTREKKKQFSVFVRERRKVYKYTQNRMKFVFYVIEQKRQRPQKDVCKYTVHTYCKIYRQKRLNAIADNPQLQQFCLYFQQY